MLQFIEEPVKIILCTDIKNTASSNSTTPSPVESIEKKTAKLLFAESTRLEEENMAKFNIRKNEYKGTMNE
jgi:hypothetical protein